MLNICTSKPFTDFIVGFGLGLFDSGKGELSDLENSYLSDIGDKNFEGAG
jgi:hypothetical protein